MLKINTMKKILTITIAALIISASSCTEAIEYQTMKVGDIRNFSAGCKAIRTDSTIVIVGEHGNIIQTIKLNQ